MRGKIHARATLVTGAILYISSVGLAFLIASWIFEGALIEPQQKFGFTMFIITWLVLTGLALELHDSGGQGFRADISDLVAAAFAKD
jgi:hypothetical protein